MSDRMTHSDVPPEYTLWYGGKCPVDENASVDLYWADGDCEINNRAGDWRWDHRGGPDDEGVEDILGYRTYGHQD